jgi:hypothetical protein
MAKLKDRWDKTEIVAKVLGAIGAIAIPILLWWLGVKYTERQRTAEDERAAAEDERVASEGRVNHLTTLLKSLSSDNSRERQMAIRIAEYLGKKNLLPPELVPVLLKISLDDPSAIVSNDAVKSLAVVSKANSSLAPEIQQALASLPNLVYIHIRHETQREKAKIVSELLNRKGFSVSGIEYVSLGPQNPQVRYFFPEKQATTAKQIADIVSGEVGEKFNPQYIDHFEDKANPKQYEVWFAP